MTEVQPPAYHSAVPTPPDVFRRAMGDLTPEGVAGASSMAVTPGTGMQVKVAAGGCFVQGDTRSGQGMYHVWNDAETTLALSAADPTQDRTDVVVARVYENAEDSLGLDVWALEIVEGTPGGGVPAVPDTAFDLASVLVAAGVTSIAGGAVTDLRGVQAASFHSMMRSQKVPVADQNGPASSTPVTWPTFSVPVAVPSWAKRASVDVTITSVVPTTAVSTKYRMWVELDGVDGLEHRLELKILEAQVALHGSFDVTSIAGTTVALEVQAARLSGTPSGFLMLTTSSLVTYDVHFDGP